MHSNQNTGWSFTFTGLDKTDSISARPLTADEGYYTATLDSTNEMADRPGTIEFNCTISEGDFKGARLSKGIKLPSVANNGFIWKSLFESLGYPQEKIEQPQFNPDPNDWNGRQVHIYWRPGNKELAVYRELLFMSKKAWERKKRGFEYKKEREKLQGSASGTNSSDTTVPTSPPPVISSTENTPSNQSNSGFDNSNTKDLLSKLRL